MNPGALVGKGYPSRRIISVNTGGTGKLKHCASGVENVNLIVGRCDVLASTHRHGVAIPRLVKGVVDQDACAVIVQEPNLLTVLQLDGADTDGAVVGFYRGADIDDVEATV